MTAEQAIEICNETIKAQTIELEKSLYEDLKITCREHIAENRMVIDVFEGKNVPVENIEPVIESFKKQRKHARMILSDCLNSSGFVKEILTRSYKQYVEWTTECILILENYRGLKYLEI